MKLLVSWLVRDKMYRKNMKWQKIIVVVSHPCSDKTAPIRGKLRQKNKINVPVSKDCLVLVLGSYPFRGRSQTLLLGRLSSSDRGYMRVNHACSRGAQSCEEVTEKGS